METLEQRIDFEHPWLVKFRKGPMLSFGRGSCVKSILLTADSLGIPTFNGGTDADPNNSRGAMVQLIRAGHWVSVQLPGSVQTLVTSVKSYGSATVWVTNRVDYVKTWGSLPNGALVFQTMHGWDYGGGATGNDIATIRENGKSVINFAPSSGLVYGEDTLNAVLCVPAAAMRR